ncbi:hypothetical protein [Afipia sp. GAS231]|uniref:hypothetical protein n=1 Tax=Afipia sp. GAS231 TaxID=1882747 RepID=UPI001FCD6C50|nr:hypothetical protein [Afipia sp. GAS231]
MAIWAEAGAAISKARSRRRIISSKAHAQRNVIEWFLQQDQAMSARRARYDELAAYCHKPAPIRI